MTEKIQTSGLCINCLNVDHCSYCRNHTKPVIFCEEFLCTDPTESGKGVFKSARNSTKSTNSAVNGICSNCEDMKICNLQKTDKNVLHCEEYR